MEVSKLKNIVIVILVLLNLFLLVLSGGRRVQDARNREDARTAAVEVIRNGGVALDEAIVPTQMNLEPLSAERDLKEELLQARTLLGGEVNVQAKGGEVYRYANDAGWLQVHSTGQYSAMLVAESAMGESEQVESRAMALLARMGIQSRVVECRVTGGQQLIVLCQTLDGVLLPDCQVTVTYTAEGGVSVTGFAVAVFMSNAGGLWDNSKKYIEAGNYNGKGSDNHKAAVVGDTVGDPFKDTAGPSVNILIKLLSMVSIVFASLVASGNLMSLLGM